MSENTVTAYKVAKALNSKLKELGYDKSVPPQMIYNYMKEGRITGKKGTGQTPTVSEAKQFIANYIERYENRLKETEIL